MQQATVRKYYFVSDLHMGGDGQLQHCDYTAEFVAFLKRLEKEGPDTELLIVGDTFGFWELTLVRGIEKLDHIIAAHQAIFDQLRATGAKIKITMMVGNHDYDLACNAEFSVKLQQYNIHLDTSLVLITRIFPSFDAENVKVAASALKSGGITAEFDAMSCAKTSRRKR
jgi:UDP-2,3-diacylglucosamine pyrophosphatase LpxH